MQLKRESENMLRSFQMIYFILLIYLKSGNRSFKDYFEYTRKPFQDILQSATNNKYITTINNIAFSRGYIIFYYYFI